MLSLSRKDMQPKMNAYLKLISLFSRWQFVSVMQLSTKAMCCLNRKRSILDSMPCSSAHSIQIKTQNSVAVQIRATLFACSVHASSPCFTACCFESPFMSSMYCVNRFLIVLSVLFRLVVRVLTPCELYEPFSHVPCKLSHRVDVLCSIIRVSWLLKLRQSIFHDSFSCMGPT